MNKLFRKLFVLLLALTVAFAAVGCDGCGDEGGDGGSYVPDTSILQPETPVITMREGLNLVVGDDYTIVPTVKHVDGDLVWQSDNEAVATVSNGKITAITDGTAKITASYNGVTATCNVNVSYGSYLPNLLTYSGIDVESSAKTVLSVGSSYAIGAYVDFNSKAFGDATFTYESSNDEVLTIDANGNVTPVKFGEDVTITVNATWRDFTVSKSFNVDVRENVLFFVNNNILQNIVVNTPASFIPVTERDNVIELNPSVKVGSNLTEDTNVSVEVVSEVGVLGQDFTYDDTNKVYTALALSKSHINLSYLYQGATYVSSFTVEAVRPLSNEVITVEMFSAGAGTYKELVDGAYVNKTLVDKIWGDESSVTLYDAYQEGNTLKVNGELVENVAVNFDTFTDTYITIGSNVERYNVALVDACAYYISNADDFIGAFEKTNRTYVSRGRYELLNDINMAGKPAILNITSELKFDGYFDGNNHSVKNLSIDIGRGDDDLNGGLLGVVSSDAVFKNVALIDLTSVQQQKQRGLLTKQLTCTIDNVYISHTVSSAPTQLVYSQTKAGSLTNVVVEYPYDKYFSFEEYRTKYVSSYGVSPIGQRIWDWTGTYNNITVIGQMPLGYYSTSSEKVEMSFNEDGTRKSWGAYYNYAENETDVWYDFEYFHNAPNDPDYPGLGIVGEVTVQNSQDIVDGAPDKSKGKTRVIQGVRRYNTVQEAYADDNCGAKAIVDGFGIVQKQKVELVGGDYDAKSGKFITTELNYKVVSGVKIDGIALIEGSGYTLDQNGYLQTINAKTSIDDTTSGVPYRINGDVTAFEFIIETEDTDYIFNGVNYWTRIIDDATELKETLDISYTPLIGENDKEIYVYNTGIYKIADTTNTIDMATVSMDYSTLTTSATKEEGGFAGYFDGNGCVIDNFAPGKHGFFGALSSYKLPVGATIKNVAFTNVIISTLDKTIRPVLFSYVTDGETNEQNIENVYVTYSSATQDMNGLMNAYYKNVNMNNVYVVSNTVVKEITEEFKDYYLDADGNSLGLDADRKYFNSMRIGNEGSRLYTSTLIADPHRITGASELDKIQNVIVASNAPISYYMPNGDYLTYLYELDPSTKSIYMADANAGKYTSGRPAYWTCSVCGKITLTGETGGTCTLTDGCSGTYVNTKKNSSYSNSRNKAFAYAGNETKGNFPVVNGFAKYIKTELTNNADNYDAFGQLMPLYYCTKCLAGTLGTVCPAGCVDGTVALANPKSAKNGITYILGANNANYGNALTSPVLFSFVLHNVADYKGKVWSADNSVVVFNGVSRYDSVDAMKAQTIDYTSFTGASGNGMWKVVEGELVWANLQA